MLGIKQTKCQKLIAGNRISTMSAREVFLKKSYSGLTADLMSKPSFKKHGPPSLLISDPPGWH